MGLKTLESSLLRSLTCSSHVLIVVSLFLIKSCNGQYNARPAADFIETGSIEGVECIANGKFYRNPEFHDGVRDCAKYYWCPRSKVLEFRCSAGLWFDVDRQICDFKSKVRNCEKSHGKFVQDNAFSCHLLFLSSNQLQLVSRFLVY